MMSQQHAITVLVYVGCPDERTKCVARLTGFTHMIALIAAVKQSPPPPKKPKVPSPPAPPPAPKQPEVAGSPSPAPGPPLLLPGASSVGATMPPQSAPPENGSSRVPLKGGLPGSPIPPPPAPSPPPPAPPIGTPVPDTPVSQYNTATRLPCLPYAQHFMVCCASHPQNRTLVNNLAASKQGTQNIGQCIFLHKLACECWLQYQQHCESIADCAASLGLSNTTGFDCACNSSNPANCPFSVRDLNTCSCGRCMCARLPCSAPDPLHSAMGYRALDPMLYYAGLLSHW